MDNPQITKATGTRIAITKWYRHKAQRHMTAKANPVILVSVVTPLHIGGNRQKSPLRSVGGTQVYTGKQALWRENRQGYYRVQDPYASWEKKQSWDPPYQLPIDLAYGRLAGKVWNDHDTSCCGVIIQSDRRNSDHNECCNGHNFGTGINPFFQCCHNFELFSIAYFWIYTAHFTPSNCDIIAFLASHTSLF